MVLFLPFSIYTLFIVRIYEYYGQRIFTHAYLRNLTRDYDFQSRQNYRNVELQWNISAEDNLMYLSGTIPTAGLASSSKMLCLFDTDSTFKYSLDSRDLEKSEASLVSLVGEKGDSVKISQSTYIPKRVHWFSHLSPVGRTGTVQFNIYNLDLWSTIHSISYPALVTFSQAHNLVPSPALDTRCTFTVQFTPGGEKKVFIEPATYRVDEKMASTIIFSKRFPQDIHELSVVCEDLTLVSHFYDDKFFAKLQTIEMSAAKLDDYSLITMKTLSPMDKAPFPRPKPIPRPVVDLLRYEVDFHPRTSAVTFAFQGNASFLTIWENTKINVVLGKLKSGSSSHLDCELKALTQQDVIVNSIETKQEATYYKTFSLDYNVDPVTRLMILSGVLPLSE